MSSYGRWRMGRVALRAALVLVIAGMGLATAWWGSTVEGESPTFAPPAWDRTANGIVSGGDALWVADAWARARGAGRCTTPAQQAADVDGSGCLSVADVQRVLAAWGEQPAGAAPLQVPSSRAGVQRFVVTSAGDEPDRVPGNGECLTSAGQCTLRAAVEEANARPGPEQIDFDVRGSGGSCPVLVTITLQDALYFDDPYGDGITVDGYSQCGAAVNDGEIVGTAQLRIELKAATAGAHDGVRITSPNHLLRGLAFYNFDRALYLAAGASYNQIVGNYVGTNAAATFRYGQNSPGAGEGIHLRYGAAYNTVGCGLFTAANQWVPCTDESAARAARNIISGNGGDGIHLEGTVQQSRIAGNYIGLNPDGSAGYLRNGGDGVDVNYGPTDTVIGGAGPLERNIISNNWSDGIEVSHNSATRFTRILGNYIGTEGGGMTEGENKNSGISLEDDVSQTEIVNNVIAANRSNGIRLYVLVSNSVIEGNLIGVAADGSTPLPNGTADTGRGRHGVYIIGGSEANRVRENTIAYHAEDGIRLTNWSDPANGGYGASDHNTISRNRIFQNTGTGILLKGERNPATGEITYSNEGLQAPIIQEATTAMARGLACAGCRVELFVSDKDTLNDPVGDNWGEGKRFVADAVADGFGSWTVLVSGVVPGELLTATATDGAGNTSQFARNVRATEAQQSSPTPTATVVLATPTATPSATGVSPTPTATSVPPTPTATASATPSGDAIRAQLQIAQRADDAEERSSDGRMYRGSSDLEMADDRGYLGKQHVGLRFQLFPVPPGATIVRAWLEFVVDERDSVATTLRIQGEANDHAGVFSGAKWNLSRRPTTRAMVPWNPPPWEIVGSVQESPDLSTILQEIIDRPGWRRFNSVALIVTGEGERTAEAYDGAPELAPRLHIEYRIETVPPTPSATPTLEPITPIYAADMTPEHSLWLPVTR